MTGTPGHEYAGWHVVQRRVDGTAYQRGPLRVIVSEGVELDLNLWRHVSVSHAGRIPDWDELGEVKETFIGDDREAYQVFPTADRYVNIHERVLHLWARLTDDCGRVLPDFTRGSGSI